MGHQNQKVVIVQTAEIVRVLQANNTRRGFRVRNLSLIGADTPVFVKLGSAPAAADVAGVINVEFSDTPGSGTWKLSYNGYSTTALSKTVSSGALQTALRLIPGLSAVTVTGSMGAGFVITMTGAEVPNSVMSVTENSLQVDAVPSNQVISFEQTLTEGSFKLRITDYRNQCKFVHETKALAYNISAAALQAVLSKLLNDSELAVTGSALAGFDISFGPNGPGPLIEMFDSTLVGNTIEKQLLTFTEVPDEGVFKLSYGLLETAAINFDDVAADVQVALRALAGLEAVVVTGDFVEGFEVVFHGVVGEATLLEVSENTLKITLADVLTTLKKTVFGEEGVLVESSGSRAFATMEVSANPIPDDTLEVNGTVITFVEEDPGDLEIELDPLDVAENANRVFEFLQESTDENISKMIYFKSGNIIMAIAKAYGTIGNSYTLDTSNDFLFQFSGDTLSGGAEAVEVVEAGALAVPINGVVAVDTAAASDQDSTVVEGEAVLDRPDFGGQELWIKGDAGADVDVEVIEYF